MVTINSTTTYRSPINSGRKRKEKIPYSFDKHCIRHELLSRMEQQEMEDKVRESFLLAVIQQQATELDRYKQQTVFERLNDQKQTYINDLLKVYDKKVDLSQDKALRNHYFELREIIKEVKKTLEKIDVFCKIKVQRIAMKNTECCHPIFLLFSRQRVG